MDSKWVRSLAVSQLPRLEFFFGLMRCPYGAKATKNKNSPAGHSSAASNDPWPST